jgi:hypothetical protein
MNDLPTLSEVNERIIEEAASIPVEAWDKLAAPSPFVPGTHLQYAWDSTSLGYLKECPRKYYYTIVEGWRGKGSSVHLEFGGLYHSALEGYDKMRATGESHENALDFIVWEALEILALALRPRHQDPLQPHPLHCLVSRPVRRGCGQDRAARGRQARSRAVVSVRA